MKTKKMFLTTVILIATAALMVIYAVVSSIALKPTITESEFDFSVTYELNGEIVTIEDVYAVQYNKNGGYTDTKTRLYSGEIVGKADSAIMYVLQEDDDGRIELNTKLYPDYLMGDPTYEYFTHEAFEPKILYYDSEEIEYTDEETLEAQGVKLISWEYPTPIENKFVFSHISIFSGGVVIPTILMGVLALIVIMIVVKKDKDFVRKPIDRISTLFNFLTVFIVVPVMAIFAMFMDITGDNGYWHIQLFYFVPAISVLCVAASVALRRKGYKKSSMWITLVGAAVLTPLIIIGLLG